MWIMYFLQAGLHPNSTKRIVRSAAPMVTSTEVEHANEDLNP